MSPLQRVKARLIGEVVLTRPVGAPHIPPMACAIVGLTRETVILCGLREEQPWVIGPRVLPNLWRKWSYRVDTGTHKTQYGVEEMNPDAVRKIQAAYAEELA